MIELAMRLVVFVAFLVIACSSPSRDGAPGPAANAPAPVQATIDAAPAVTSLDATPQATPRPAHDHDALDPELEALKQQLGASGVTCAGTAKLLASQGTAEPKVVDWRERSVLRLCKADKWSARVRECVQSATHDQLSCTAYLETRRQRRRWDAVFEKWIDPFDRDRPD